MAAVVSDVDANSAKTDEILEVLTDYGYTPMQPVSTESGYYHNNNHFDSENYHVNYYEVSEGEKYAFSAVLPKAVNIMLVSWFDDERNLLNQDTYSGSMDKATAFNNQKVIAPLGACYLGLNIRNATESAFNVSSVTSKYYNIASFVGGNDDKALKVVINTNGTFHVRTNIDDNLDGILCFRWYRNSLCPYNFYIGNKEDSDDLIINQEEYHYFNDISGPLSTRNFGPMYGQHGYCHPRCYCSHNLTSEDLHSEWVDQSGYHYTVENITATYIDLLPIIYNKDNPGYETRDWKSYNDIYPTVITHVSDAVHTDSITIDNAVRHDVIVNGVDNLKYIVDGSSVNEGTFYCNEFIHSAEYIGYNPIKVDKWFPSPVYNGEMARFKRQWTMIGGRGLSMTQNTIINIEYPVLFDHFYHVMPIMPIAFAGYDSYTYIPKLKKLPTEFLSNSISDRSKTFYRNTADMYDVDDIPDRGMTELRDTEGNVLFGYAGGHSLVSGQSTKEYRNARIRMNSEAGLFVPSLYNKLYLKNMSDPPVLITDEYVSEWEGYFCWYKPEDGIHTFYHKSGSDYVVYIHVKEAKKKGKAKLPLFMDGMRVTETVEKTDGFTLLTTSVNNGTLYFNAVANTAHSDASDNYNWIVIKIRK